MTAEQFYRNFSSDCTAGSANQVLTRFPTEKTVGGRCYYRLSHGGKNYSLLFSNRIDSTYADGGISVANDLGGTWEILALRVGLCDTHGAQPAHWYTCTFDGAMHFTVSGDTVFACDPIPLDAPAGAYLCYDITVRGACYPYHEEITLTVLSGEGDVRVPDKRIPVPLMIGCDRPVTRRIGFIGDSITQGCGTEYDSYTHWVAKIAEGLPDSYSVWDLGIGFARGYDAATDMGWLARAKTCDTVNVCFGVNDIFHARTAREILSDLATIVTSLKAAGCHVILMTVPPFSMEGNNRDTWYAVNEAILAGKINADAIFNVARSVGQPAPNTHLAAFGSHPNADGCANIARDYLASNIL